MPVPPAGQVLPPDVLNTHIAWVKASKEIVVLMLMTMDPDIQKNLEHLGAYDMLKELKISLILVSLRKEYDGLVQNYNMHSMGKTVTELHDMLKLHEQTLPPKEVAPALHAIRAERIQKNQKKKSHKAGKGNQGKGKAKMGYALMPTPPFAPKPKNPPTPKKDNPAKDAICHQYGEVGHWRRNYPIYLAELMKIRSYLNELALQDDIYEIVLSSSNTNDSSMYVVSNKRAKLNLDSPLLWHCLLRHISKKCIKKLQHDGLLDSTEIKSFKKCVTCMSGKMARKPYSHEVERARDLLGLIYTDRRNRTLLDTVSSMMSQTTLLKSFWDYAHTSLNHKKDEQEIDEPQSDINPIRRSTRIRRAPDRMCLYIDAEEHELGDFGEPANYKAALLDPESDKWLNAMNVEMQSIKDNEEAFRQWNKRFNDEIKKFGFNQNRDEPCVYVKASGSYVTFLILYVNDILIMENNILMLQDVKSYLGRCFVIKDLGEAAYILGIKIYQDRSKRLIGLCQRAYIEKILKRFYMENSKHGMIPMQEKLKFSKSQGASTPAEIQLMQNILYVSAVGSIMYDVRYTRPDVAFAQNITSDTKRELRVSCYTDAGHLTDADDMMSQTRYVFWSHNNSERSWITKGARHFRAKVHYLRETIEMGDVKIEKVDAYDNLVDPFTQALAFPKHSELTKEIGMIPASSLM
nr:hypothetical protein [Tanacetum cinerariifolium]